MDYKDIVFQVIKATATGDNATTGREMQNKFNENFDLVKQLFEQLFLIVSLQVSSETIKQVKVDTEVNPHKLYYSIVDDPSEEDWLPLVRVNYSDIEGNPLDSIALKEALDSKASTTQVSEINVTLQSHESLLQEHKEKLDDHAARIGVNEVNIKAIQDTLPYVVKTTPGDTLYLRYLPGTEEIEYSTDNTTWVNINQTHIQFANLVGEVTDCIPIVNYVRKVLDETLVDYARLELLNAHTVNNENPHNVTKEQLGLDKVENYSPADMPLSLEAQKKFSDIEQRWPSFEFITQSGYFTLQDNGLQNVVYMISSHFMPGDGQGGD